MARRSTAETKSVRLTRITRRGGRGAVPVGPRDVRAQASIAAREDQIEHRLLAHLVVRPQLQLLGEEGPQHRRGL